MEAFIFDLILAKVHSNPGGLWHSSRFWSVWHLQTQYSQTAGDVPLTSSGSACTMMLPVFQSVMLSQGCECGLRCSVQHTAWWVYLAAVRVLQEAGFAGCWTWLNLKAENGLFGTRKRFFRKCKFKWTTSGAGPKRTCPMKTTYPLCQTSMSFMHSSLVALPVAAHHSLLTTLEISPLLQWNSSAFRSISPSDSGQPYVCCSCDFFHLKAVSS